MRPTFSCAASGRCWPWAPPQERYPPPTRSNPLLITGNAGGRRAILERSAHGIHQRPAARDRTQHRRVGADGSRAVAWPNSGDFILTNKELSVGTKLTYPSARETRVPSRGMGSFHATWQCSAQPAWAKPSPRDGHCPMCGSQEGYTASPASGCCILVAADIISYLQAGLSWMAGF